ncbi:MAG: hypothetical protein V4642_01920 [Bacteroidota bacterium]
MIKIIFVRRDNNESFSIKKNLIRLNKSVVNYHIAIYEIIALLSQNHHKISF